MFCTRGAVIGTLVLAGVSMLHAGAMMSLETPLLTEYFAGMIQLYCSCISCVCQSGMPPI